MQIHYFLKSELFGTQSASCSTKYNEKRLGEEKNGTERMWNIDNDNKKKKEKRNGFRWLMALGRSRLRGLRTTIDEHNGCWGERRAAHRAHDVAESR